MMLNTALDAPIWRQPATEQFGIHLMIDGYDARAERLADARLLRHLLDTLPARLGMHPISTPVLVQVGPQNRRIPAGCRAS